MPKVISSTVIDAPREEVWRHIREFAGRRSWFTDITKNAPQPQGTIHRIGSVHQLVLSDQIDLQERLLSVSDLEFSLSVCLLETSVPLFNYVAHYRLHEISDRRRTFWECEAQFDTPAATRDEMVELVRNTIFEGGFSAIRNLTAGEI